MRFATAAAMKAADNEAINGRGIPSLTLMYTAAGFIAQECEGLMGSAEGKNIEIFAGSGNNGGDGFAAAAILASRGAKCRVWFTGKRDKLSQDCAHTMAECTSKGISVMDFDYEAALDAALKANCIIDAMFGVGLNSPLRGAALEACRVINSASAPVVAADLPSGIHADTGEILGDAVTADSTVTFSCAKPGLFSDPGVAYSGKVTVCDIGIPKDILDEYTLDMDIITRPLAAKTLPRRKTLSHKGDNGKVMVFAGSKGYTGASYLASNAASRAGAGLVWLGVPESTWAVLASKCVEVMPYGLADTAQGAISCEALPLALEKLSAANVCLIGPGLGRQESTMDFSRSVIKNAHCPLVIDADGIYSLASHIDILKETACVSVITPHEGEFARLCPDFKTLGRIEAARRFSVENRCVTVLKGHATLVCSPQGAVRINTTGNPGLAKGGSGDVLAGVIAAMIAQGLESFEAAQLGVWLHGAAGDAAAAKFGMHYMSPADTMAALSDVLKEL
ncbi:MAG: NAD(P)H-hydrate dehydratase [Oscillospiraceae bacterium]|nr:NAD(P)H-hydrate dehydratase [Oscillospiraceae bacterium]